MFFPILSSFDAEKNFVGRSEILNDFRNVLDGIKSRKEGKRGIIVTGKAGCGKSLLLKLFSNLADAEGWKISSFSIPLGRDIQGIARKIVEDLSSFFPSEDKKIQKVVSLLPQVSLIFPGVELSEVEETVKNSFKAVKEFLEANRLNVIFLIDCFERFILKGYTDLTRFFTNLVEWLEGEKISVLFVFALDERFLPYFGEKSVLIDRFSLVELRALGVREAEILINRVTEGANISSLADEVRKNIVLLTDRTPFSIIYTLASIADFVGDPSIEITMEKWQEMGGDDIFERLMPAPLNALDDEERKVLKFLARTPVNISTLQEVEINLAPNIAEEGLEGLKSKGILVVEDDFLQFVSNALFELLHKREEIDPLTMLYVYVDLVTAEIDKGWKASATLIRKISEMGQEIVKEGGESFRVYDLAVKIEKLAKRTLEKKFLHDAFSLFTLSGALYTASGDVERAGITYDEASKAFIELDRPIFAKMLLIQASEFFKSIGTEWKGKSMAREAVYVLEDLARDFSSQNMNAIASAYLYSALKLCEIAGDEERRKEILQKALAASSDLERKRSFFEKL